MTEVLRFSCIDKDPSRSYKILIEINRKLPDISEIETINNNPNAPTKFPHCTETAETCPFLNSGNSKDLLEKLRYEFLVGFLLEAMNKSYIDKKPVDWRIKDAYIQCLRVLKHCEPLETQRPMF